MTFIVLEVRTMICAYQYVETVDLWNQIVIRYLWDGMELRGILMEWQSCLELL